METTWKFLVVENLAQSVIGVDFIAAHHKDSWCFKHGTLWLDDKVIPIIGNPFIRIVKAGSSCPVIAKCTVELPARHQALVRMRTKDRSTQGGMFESFKTPGGLLLTKTVVQPSKDGRFVVKAVNLNLENVTLFKNQKIGTLSGVEEVISTMDENVPASERCPSVSLI